MDQEIARERFQQADKLFQQGCHEESLAILTALNQEFPNQKNIMFAAAKNMEKLGMIDEAKFLCHQMIRSFDYDKARRLLNNLEVAPRIAVQAANETDFPADEAPHLARASGARVQGAEENKRNLDSVARNSSINAYYVVGTVALLLILLALPLVFRSGEESVPQASVEGAAGQAADVTSDGRPRGLPPDIPLYPEMEYVHSEPWMTEGALMSVFLTRRTEAEVVAFYDDAFISMGYEREGPEFFPLFESTFYNYGKGEQGILMAFEPDTSLRPGQGYLSVSIMTPYADDTPDVTPGGVTAQIPAGFPSDVPVYPGLQITSAEVNADGFKVEGTTSDSYDAVTSFYDTTLESYGWKDKSGSSMSMPFLGVMEEASKRFKYEPVLRTVELTTKLQNNIVTVIMETSPDPSAFDVGLRGGAVPEPTVMQVEPRPERTIILLGNVPLDLVEIHEGTFTMGSPDTERLRSIYEGPQRSVTIRNPFWLGKQLVTQAQWTAVMGTSLREQRDKHISAMRAQNLAPHIAELLSELAGEGPEYPMYFISWEECQEFIGKLNAGGQGTFRLPSEAEWEYACRAGSTTPYHFGHTDEKLSEYAWNEDTDGVTTYIVGQKRPNAWGLYDMIGNVMQWCEDDWHEQYIGAPGDERAWINSPRNRLRLVRGSIAGSGFGRSAHRHGNCPPDSRANYFGFRVAWNP